MDRRDRTPTLLGPGARQSMTAALALTLALFLLPAVLFRDGPLYPAPTQDGPPSAQLLDPAQPTQAAKDKGRAVKLLHKDGSVEELPMDQYLWGVAAAEMPASFQPEALKAQVCAARTYTVLRQSGSSDKHPQAQICTDSTCCQAYIRREDAQARWGLNAGEYSDKIQQAVVQTDGLGILYQGRPIQALFFSSAAGRTVDAVEVWGNSVDYLKSVPSPEGEEVPNYRTQSTFTPSQVKELALASYPGADLSGDPSSWFGPPSRNPGGGVISQSLGGVTLTGGQLRRLFSLRSATFELTWDGAVFTFQTTGYGHGVGMSQYGANAMAKQGKDFREILTWYYTGAQVDDLW